jgi:DNA-directed RNA polymerase subunit RPC12/RpoP
MNAPSKPQFRRFLDVAQEDRRSHLQEVFATMFVSVVRSDDDADESPATVPNIADLLAEHPLPHSECNGSANGCEVDFACVRCGSPSVALPEKLTDESDVRCGSCCYTLMTWKRFKAICEGRTLRLSEE